MATVNVTGMERAASLALSSRSSISPKDDAKTTVTETDARSGSHIHKLRPNDAESIDTQQPAGLQQMQGITLTWTKEWLINAYCL